MADLHGVDHRLVLLTLLKSENEELRERIAQLEAVLFSTEFTPPLEWGLTSSEARVFGALLAKPLLTKQVGMLALYSDRLDAPPEPKILDVFVHKLRRKLKPFGILVLTQVGEGWRLDVATRDRFRRSPQEQSRGAA